jgi:hypothetical protein
LTGIAANTAGYEGYFIIDRLSWGMALCLKAGGLLGTVPLLGTLLRSN